MTGLLAQLVGAWRGTSGIEIIAACLAVAYLLLAIKQQRGCWVAAFVSSSLYVRVLFAAHLYMESLLQAFYAVMAVYGYVQWSRGASGRALQVTRWPWSRTAMALAAAVALSLTTSFFLRRFTPAAWPFMDSLVTWTSVVATFLVARKVYENWHWWFIIDSVSLCLYYNRGLYVTMLLFGAYLVMIVAGMREWRRSVDPTPHAAQPV